MKKIFLIIFLGSLLFPSVSLAGEYQIQFCNDANNNKQCDPGESIIGTGNATYDGLVPCGKEVKVDGTTKIIPCQFCHFFVMFKSILDFVLVLVIVIGVLMLTIGGFMFLFAGGSPKILDSAKRILTSTVIGLVIIFAAWLIVNSILTFPGLINPQFDWDPTKWFQVECSIKLP